MRRLLKTSAWSFILFIAAAPLFAQAPELLTKSQPPARSEFIRLSPLFVNLNDPQTFGRLFDSRVVCDRRDEGKERELLREQWEEFLGIDVFYPYYKVKQVEKYVKDRTKVEFFQFKGRAEFDEGSSSSFRYIFRKKF
jgi:hypothetical protein